MSKKRNNTTGSAGAIGKPLPAQQTAPVDKVIGLLDKLELDDLKRVLSACHEIIAHKYPSPPPGDMPGDVLANVQVAYSPSGMSFHIPDDLPKEHIFQAGMATMAQMFQQLVIPSMVAQKHLEIVASHTINHIMSILPLSRADQRTEAKLSLLRADLASLHTCLTHVDNCNHAHRTAGVFKDSEVDVTQPLRVYYALRDFLAPVNSPDPLGKTLRAIIPEINPFIETLSRAVALGGTRINDPYFKGVMRAIELAAQQYGGNYESAMHAAAGEYGIDWQTIKNWLYKPGVKPPDRGNGAALAIADDQT